MVPIKGEGGSDDEDEEVGAVGEGDDRGDQIEQQGGLGAVECLRIGAEAAGYESGAELDEKRQEHEDDLLARPVGKESGDDEAKHRTEDEAGNDSGENWTPVEPHLSGEAWISRIRTLRVRRSSRRELPVTAAGHDDRHVRGLGLCCLLPFSSWTWVATVWRLPDRSIADSVTRTRPSSFSQTSSALSCSPGTSKMAPHTVLPGSALTDGSPPFHVPFL